MSTDGAVARGMFEQEHEPAVRARRSFRWIVTLSYLLAGVIFFTLVYLGEPWAIAADTRFLDFMIRSGMVAFTDIHKGFIEGIPDFRYYIWSQEPIAWHLVLVVVLMYFAHWGLRALQFHFIGRSFGLKGSLGQHARAYFYGLGLNHVLPFNAGYAGMAAALDGEGESPRAAGAAIQVQSAFMLFEIVVFSLIGLVLTGWRLWLIEITWPLLILLLVYLLVRPGKTVGGGVAGVGTLSDKWAVLRALAEEP